jgi:release factor glutamine methyltransferase
MSRPPEPPGNVAEIVRAAARRLSAAGCDTGRLDAEVLLAHVLGVTRVGLHLRWREPLDPAAAGAFAGLVERRAAHEPVAYLIGERAFYDVALRVKRHVPIPRPEPEHLVEEALAWAAAAGHDGRSLRLADVGTGSGALAVVLARRLPRVHVWAVDLSPAALAVAADNVARYDLAGRVLPLCGDLLAPLAGPLDLIVANLPYVRRDEVPMLMPDVAAHEPWLALDGGADGLDLIRRLLPQAAERLAQPGLLLLEIDPRQAEAAAALAQEALADAQVAVRQDHAGRERVVRIERGQPGPDSGE